MLVSTRMRLSNAAAVAVCAIAAIALAACTSSSNQSMVSKTKVRSKEYFAESEYGVKASPRVTQLSSNLPRGGGRDQIGRPYKVRGKVYYPKEDPNYRKVGAASWYGDAFHGRLTANGEIYDMTHLTAAHPTMPLPSYARVTNMETGSSIIVRVNDRGPYAHGRIIDLSRRAAELLDYAHAGTAKVEVEYVGRAPLHGQDEEFLMASYRPAGQSPDPSDGLATGVMIAMNGDTPSASYGAPAFPGLLSDSAGGEIPLPVAGPIVPERPGVFAGMNAELAAMSFAPQSSSLGAAVAALDRVVLSEADLIASWRRDARAQKGGAYVVAGSFGSAEAARNVAENLARYGRVELEASLIEGNEFHTVNLYGDGSHSFDQMLAAAWASGAPDALVVRD